MLTARHQVTSLQTTSSQEQSPEEEKEATLEKKGTRALYGELNCYVVDAKSYGNVGRYLNVSSLLGRKSTYV